MTSKKSGWSSIRWLMVDPNTRLSVRSEVYKVCILYGNKWRSWCIMRITELFEGSNSQDKRFVDFTLSVVSRSRCDFLCWLTVSGHCELFMLACRLPVSLNLSRKRFVVKLIGAFLPGKSLRNCRWVWTTDLFTEYNLDPLLHGTSCCLIHWSWEIKLWSSDYCMIYLENRAMG